LSAKDHIDKAGIIGATFAALCCLGMPAILSVVSAIGLGFLIRDAVLAPLLILSVVLVVYGLVRGLRRHRHRLPLVIGAVAGVALVAATLVGRSRPIAFASVAALVAASLMNTVLLHRMIATEESA